MRVLASMNGPQRITMPLGSTTPPAETAFTWAPFGRCSSAVKAFVPSGGVTVTLTRYQPSACLEIEHRDVPFATLATAAGLASCGAWAIGTQVSGAAFEGSFEYASPAFHNMIALVTNDCGIGLGGFGQGVPFSQAKP